jgi:hypothetical protein
VFGDETGVVLRDLDGNGFCVPRPAERLNRPR